MVRQVPNLVPRGGIDEFCKSWQESLQRLINALSDDDTRTISYKRNRDYVGTRISGQIFELLGKKVFPSNLEADLITLRALFDNFDDIYNKEESLTCLLKARKMLSRIRSASTTSPILSVQKSSLPHPSRSSMEGRLAKPKSDTELWNLPIRFAKGVGPSRARLLEKLGVTTIEEAFWFLPWRYEDWSVIVPIGHLQADMKTTVKGRVTSCSLRRTSRKGFVILAISIDDGTGVLGATFFNQPFLEQVFQIGRLVLLHGEVSRGKAATAPLHMKAPQYELIQGDGGSSDGMGRLVPVYHETKGLTTRQFRRILGGLYESYGLSIKEILPSGLTNDLQFPLLRTAVETLHFPSRREREDQLNLGTTIAHQRLAFEELLLLQLALAVRRRMVKTESEGIVFSFDNQLISKFLEMLPFKLTSSQMRVVQEIKSDMMKPISMNRLLQGDVGSGKTMVALYAMVLASGAGYQSAFMAPTEVLSEQHFLTFEPYFKQLGITAVLVKGGQSPRERTRSLKQLSTGQAQIVVGTHALLQPDVEFSNLGFVVVDEQHKFGVVQRGQLRKKGERSPDVLVMTATPIPRTLAMTVYGDLDVSVIDKLPPGRKVVQTRLFPDQERSKAYALLRREVNAGRQAYIVYPLVDPSEKLDLQAAVQAAEVLQREVFPDFNIGLLHGRMKSKEKQAVMNSFKDGAIHVLVATTVIEVGVDVSNATVILIEHAERFGLAQLHQLRGRVGRGAEQAHCLLIRSTAKQVPHEIASLSNPKLPLVLENSLSEDRKKSLLQCNSQQESHRLGVFTRCADGFSLAEEDLKIRGPGNILGVQQWGTVEFRVADVVRDRKLLDLAKRVTAKILTKDPQLNSPELHELKVSMLRKWGKTFELSSIG